MCDKWDNVAKEVPVLFSIRSRVDGISRSHFIIRHVNLLSSNGAPS